MKNTLYYGDNLRFLREHIATESVYLTYLDPQSKAPLLAADPAVAAALLAVVDPLRLGAWMDALPAAYRGAIRRVLGKAE